ncbi:hypothetical protein LY78DRAFT_685848 [Colletotrichum sublineola]|uniref:Putative SOM1 protein n=1 Tax=Colletotrichum sublineola TaxID=1173701 RepID=A0A066X8M9_COLSU|nr:hypothetical protein LY78DRAFT_685848 [Colletotrichum sublineola]KDN65287.1 putative SOM1 protein [Colletotrichum sublineola]
MILVDTVKEDDLQIIRDMWDIAKPFRAALLLTAVKEKSSDAMLDFLIEHVQFPDPVGGRRNGVLFDIFKAAIGAGDTSIFNSYSIQKLLSSYQGEERMMQVIQKAGAGRKADMVEVVAPQIPPPLFGAFVESIIPYKANEEAEADAVDCLQRIRHMHFYKMRVNGHLKALGARCCSVRIAQLLVKDGAIAIRSPFAVGHSALSAATKHTDQSAAEFIKFMLDNGARVDEVYNGIDISTRPAAKSIQRWLGVTWEMLVEKYRKKSTEPKPSSAFPSFNPVLDGMGGMVDFNAITFEDPLVSDSVLNDIDFDSLLQEDGDSDFNKKSTEPKPSSAFPTVLNDFDFDSFLHKEGDFDFNTGSFGTEGGE